VHDADVREQIAEERAAAMEAASALQKVEAEVSRLRASNFDFETEAAKLRRALKEDPEDPAQARLRDELVMAQGRAVELERLLRQREPLNVQFLRIQIDEMQRQRDNDRRKLQEQALAITRLEQSLCDAREASHLNRGDGDSTNIDANASMGSPPSPFHGSVTSATLAVALEPSQSVSNFGRDRQPGRRVSMQDLTMKLPGRDVATQCEAGAARLVELLKKREDVLHELREEKEAVAAERDELADTVASLQSELSLMRESERRKDELLDELTSPQRLRRLSTFKSKDALEHDEAGRVLLSDKCRKLESTVASAEERAASAEARTRQLEVEVGRLTRSFATVAEENVQLSHSLQAIGNMSAKEIAAMLTAGDKVNRLRAELAEANEALERERVAAGDIDRLSRDNGALKARLEKSQLEVGALATESAKLERELQDAHAIIERQQPFVDNYRAGVRAMAQASARSVEHLALLHNIAQSSLSDGARLFADSVQTVSALRAFSSLAGTSRAPSPL